MIYLSAQPNELYFLWQSRLQMANFKEMNVPMEDVHLLVSDIAPQHNNKWKELASVYGCKVHFIPDTRVTKHYFSSIRPNLIAQFLEQFPEYQTTYMFYTDGDVMFTREPVFEGMLDGRWHVSKADYISYEYIKSKHSKILLNNMLDIVGIDEETVKLGDINAGGVHYLIPRSTPEFWKSVEFSCEQLYNTVQNENHMIYKAELYNTFYLPNARQNNSETVSFEEWLYLPKEQGGYDFQIWCADLWAIYWELLNNAIDVYANPELQFSWPGWDITDWNKHLLFHNSGATDKDRGTLMIKQDYKEGQKYSSPFDDPDIKDKGYKTDPETGQRIPLLQTKYLSYIAQSVADYANHNSGVTMETTVPIIDLRCPFVSCVMTTYGRHTLVERSIALWLSQTYTHKELIIYNTADVPLVLSEELQYRGIRIINNNIDHQTHKAYDNVGAVRRDATVYATGDYYACWDDDDFYLPWHIEQGMDYLRDNPWRKAYMPMKSFYTPDGGTTISLEQNSMEASCIVDISEIRSYGFDNSNGGEHLSWRMGLRDRDLLREDYSVTPFESYMYVWGEPISPRKQSGYINDPNNFENHKLANTDFGDRPLKHYSQAEINKWYFKLNRFVNNEEFFKRISTYVR